MKRVMAVLLVICMILLTPAYAAAVSSGDQNFDPMNVKGKGTDVEAANELINETNVENSISGNETSNTTMGTLYTDEELSTANITENTTENTTINNTEDLITSETPQNEENSTETTEQPVSNLDNGIEKPVAENETITSPVINTTGIVMQTTNYTCGPAALATVLNNMGINATEQELAILAGTDENGTTMHGLVNAAKSKGLNAKGMNISVNNLRKNHIVFLTINGNTHYSVIREVTNESVFIADPSLGNIEMTLGKFSESYSGYAIVITDPNNTNGTNETTNLTETNSTEDISLTEEEMQNIKGMYHYDWVDGYWSWKPGYFSWVPGRWAWQPGWWYWHSGYFYWVSGHWARWWIFWYYVPGYLAWHSGWWAWHSGYYYWIPGYWHWNPGHWIWNPGYWKTVYDYNLQNEMKIAEGAGKIGLYLWLSVLMTTYTGFGGTSVIVGGYNAIFLSGVQELQENWDNPVWV